MSCFSLFSCSGLPVHLLVIAVLIAVVMAGIPAALHVMSMLLLAAFASRQMLRKQPTQLQLTTLWVFTHNTSLCMGHLLLIKMMPEDGNCNGIVKVPVKSHHFTDSSAVSLG